MPTGNILNQRNVTFEFEGRTIIGAYSVWSTMITVMTRLGSETTQVGGASSERAMDCVARIMLRELEKEGKT